MWMNFAVGCYKLEQIQIGDPMYRFDNGGLYYRTSKGYELRFYCPGTKNKEFILPAWSNGIRADNLYENPYLKTIRYHKDFTFFPAQKDLAKSLENIFIESGSENGYSVDGVAFIPALTSSGRIYYSRYPANSKNKTFTVPKDAHMEFTTWDGDKIRNPYLETLYIPIGTSLAISNWNKISDYFPNLKTIYIETGHPSYEYYKTNFSGNVLLY